VNDTLIVSGAFEGPLLVSLGFLVSVGAMGFVLTRAFVESARELDNLSRRLEHLVVERTRELVDAEAALLRAEQMAAIGQLSAGVAHEINNPAAAVAANVGYLRDGLATGALPADALACLDDSIESIDRIAKIVRQLLDSSRAAASARSLGCMASVGRTVQQALGDARARLAPHLTVAVDVPEGLYVRADESSLVQVLVNLLVNGAQAIPQGTASARLEVRARAEGATVTIEVIDDGAGMSEETRRRLFEPFYTTKALGDGTGLGLPVSRGLVRSMGGELYVGESRPGRTAMCVRLAAGVAPSSRPAHKPMAASAGRRSLLVVDDDPHVARALLRSLGDAFDVELASGVAHALARLGEQPFDVVLTDLQMPDGGGLRLFRELEARSPDQAARLILVTGGQTSEADLAFVGAHRLELLAKPIVTDELFEALRRVEAGHRVAA
jgi:signal transduction histidine kinase/ActR/RegA family two-component response regulator